ncbi:hypothetical protein RHSIM_Rhsim07G0160600 [Rhododendron simsii]|uniref:DUF4094 domain-containing protein n=1 Tax=Rhododendron simsii TaxID=118357 RepID=A0A834LJ60_RHOSS|nr:hypothetical protein RHSIM_Rhsim07G0160600 [Rhododendron simsii]
MDISSPYREGLPTTTKADRRWRSKPLPTSSKPSILLAFFSCVAWLYIAGRLWQDAENRNLLANLLKKNAEQRPKVLTVEDKLMVLGCKDLERRIVEAEMELTLAKSQGYLQNKLQQSGSSSGKRLLAVIGVYTGFGSRLKRNVFRGSWMPKGDALIKLEERGVVMRFVIGRSANRGDSLDRIIDEENQLTKDFLILEGHEEAQEELPKKAKFFFSTAIQNWDADFYVKVDDNIDLDLEGVIELLESRRGQDSAYLGCMKSGEVITEEGKPWYEPEWWKFGDEKSDFELQNYDNIIQNYDNISRGEWVICKENGTDMNEGPDTWMKGKPVILKNQLANTSSCFRYFRHAGGALLILSKNLAQYVNVNRDLEHCPVDIKPWKKDYQIWWSLEMQQRYPELIWFGRGRRSPTESAAESVEGVLLSPGGGSTGMTLEELLPLMERLYALQGFGTKEDLMQWSFTFKRSFQVKSYCNARILGRSYKDMTSLSLKTYAHDDISVGSWMMGLQASYIDDSRLCCSNLRQDKVCSVA